MLLVVSPPWPPEFTGHAAQYNAAPAHTPQAPGPSNIQLLTLGHQDIQIDFIMPRPSYQDSALDGNMHILTRVSGTLYCYRNGVQISSHTNPVQL